MRWWSSIVAASIPFGFALIRAVSTRGDVRYFWVALAGLLGGIATLCVFTPDRGKRVAAASAIFVVATVSAVAAALLIGTRLGLGVLVVGAAFGFWFAVAGILARRS